MDRNLESFLAQEKQSLHAEQQRLSARSVSASFNCNQNNSSSSEGNNNNEVECAALQMLRNIKNFNEIKCNRISKLELEKCLTQQKAAGELVLNNQDIGGPPQANVNELPPTNSCVRPAVHTQSSMATVGEGLAAPTLAQQNASNMPSDLFDFYQHFAKDIDIENASSAPGASINGDGKDTNMRESAAGDWLKIQKDLANHKELNFLTTSEGIAESHEMGGTAGLRKSRNKDDMEQWVSDTFYSYFPGFNNEYQKRQNLLRERQLEYQQNLLKHQQLTHPANPLKTKDTNTAQGKLLPTTARSNTTVSSTDKTDLEIIVTNPNYASKYGTTRPSSTRHKLLQDLQHTELSNILTGNGVIERNRHSAEIELARKKDYQRELMQQIEEKRRSIEILREKERHQEEVLTRRLQEQLKTIHLEEELEKEKIRVEKLRFNTEQNRIMREQLLSKLENDGKLLNTHKSKNAVVKKQVDTSADNSIEDETNNNNNKVYKYFSNSARHEYRRGHPMPANVELDLELPESLSTPPQSSTERECFHLSEKVCPMCDAPLKNYQSCCLRCQRRLSLKIKPPAKSEPQTSKDAAGQTNAQSYSLVCSKCERLYALCPSCLAKSDVCRACHRERNVCMNCRRTLCSFCLEEIASGRDTERCHINDKQDVAKKMVSPIKIDSGGTERSFQVLDMNYDPHSKSNVDDAEIDASPAPANNINNNNNNKLTNKRPPYSINIERNSIFHSSYEPTQQPSSLDQLPKIVDKHLSFDLDSSLQTDENSNLERVRKETDRRLSRYLKNYGDLTKYRSQSESRDRSTQTTPATAARRDVVLHEEHNLSMPLLRKMPRLTRKETPTQLVAQTNSRRMMDNLKRRWEIPAVQKYTISPSSPPVLTQVGAIRRQLQEDRLLSDDY